MGRRIDRRIERTRKLLQESLFKLILDKGYENIRVMDITDEANLGRATFYLHYKDKEDLLLSTIKKIQQDLIEKIKTDPLSNNVPGFDLLFEYAASNRIFFEVILHKVEGRQKIFDVLVTPVKAALEIVLADAPLPLDLVVHFMVGAIMQVLDWWLVNDMPIPIDEVEGIAMQLLTGGLSSAIDVGHVQSQLEANLQTVS